MQNNNHSNIMKPQKRGKKIAIFIIIVIIIGFVAGAYFIINSRSNQKDSLNNTKTFKEAQDSFNNFPGVSKLLPSDKEKLKKDIEPQYLAGYVTGFGPNSNEIETAKVVIGDQANYESIKAFIENIINGKLELAKSTGYFQGYVYNYWYGNTIVNKFPNEEIKDWGNASVLESDKKYAKTKADEDRTKLRDNKISPAALALELNSNTRLQLYDQANGSSYFQTALNNSDDIISKLNIPEPNPGQIESFNKLLSITNTKGVTEISSIVADPGFPVSGNKREVGYLMAYIEVILKGNKDIDKYNNQLNISRRKLN